MLRTCAFLFCGFLSLPALAVYRCESGGQVTYSDTACAAGKTIELGSKVNDPVTADAASDAKSRAARDRQTLDRIEAAQQRDAARDEKRQHAAAKTKVARDKKCASLALHRQWAADDARHATVKGEEKAKKKARRAAEKEALECKA